MILNIIIIIIQIYLMIYLDVFLFTYLFIYLIIVNESAMVDDCSRFYFRYIWRYITLYRHIREIFPLAEQLLITQRFSNLGVGVTHC